MENIEAVRKDLKRFKNVFVLSTEGISYVVIIPLLILYVWINFNLTYEQTILMLKCAGAAVLISTVTTNLNDMIVISPIVKYFNKLLRGETVSEEEYERAQRRFFSLPYLHAIGSFFRWIWGLLLAIVPLLYLGDLTPMQQTNMWLIFAAIPPLGGLLFFFLTETYIQKLLNKGIFNRIAFKEFNWTMSLMTRIILSVLIILIVPIIGINGYYSIIIESARMESSVSYLKLGGIILFGLIVALSVVVTLWRSVRDKIRLISNFLTKIGAGDLTAQKGVIAIVDELTSINQTVYIMKKNITEMMSDINSISSKLDASTHEISSITRSFSEVTQTQAATVEEVTATIEEISAGMDGVATGAQGQMKSLLSLIERMEDLSRIIQEMEENISSAWKLSTDISMEAARGEESLMQMNDSMLLISTTSQEMTSIVGIINDISDKINLLSLNASIEAARAGDAGRGFAVVADEISKLAESTASSVKDIDGLIKSSDNEIRKGLSGVTDVVERIGRITAGISAMGGMVDKIAKIMQKQIETNVLIDREATSVKSKSQEIETATAEQKIAITEVVNSVTRINELTQTISAGSEEITANTQENAKIAEILKKKVDQFKLA